MRPSHPVRHFWPLRNQRFFCSRLRSGLVGLCLLNALAFFLALLTGIACKRRPKVLRKFRLVDELFEFLQLAIRQRVHRIDHDRACATFLPGYSGPNGPIEVAFATACA